MFFFYWCACGGGGWRWNLNTFLLFRCFIRCCKVISVESLERWTTKARGWWFSMEQLLWLYVILFSHVLYFSGFVLFCFFFAYFWHWLIINFAQFNFFFKVVDTLMPMWAKWTSWLILFWNWSWTSEMNFASVYQMLMYGFIFSCVLYCNSFYL